MHLGPGYAAICGVLVWQSAQELQLNLDGTA